jgi:hypothetical protein
MERLVTFEQFAEQKAKKDQVQLEEELNAKREASANSFKDLLAEFGVTSMSELSEEDKPKFNERLGTLTESALLLEGTRGQFGIIDKKGNIQSVYTHYDSYPENMLPLIKKHYKDAKKAKEVIAKGDNSGLDALDKMKFYGDGRGPMTGKKSDINSYIRKANDEGGAEYVYLYDEADKKWYMADIYAETGLVPAFEALVAEAVAISGKRTAKKLALRLTRLFDNKLTALKADKVTMLGFLKELYFSAMEDANFSREGGVSMNKIKGKISPLEVKVAGLDNESIRISAKTVKLMVDKYYSDMANAGDWSGIGITEGFAMYLDQIGEGDMGQALIDSFNAQFEGEEKRVSRTEKLYELSQKNVEEDRAEEIEDDGIEMANEAKESAWDKLNRIADEQYGEFGFATLGEDEMANHIDMKKADKLADKEYGEFGFASLGEGEMEELINNNPKLVKESAVTEAEIKSDDEFKEYAFTVLQKAFGEDFDEAKAQEVVDGILGKVDGDYGKAAGILQASLG